MDSSPYSPPAEEFYYRDRLSATATATPSPRDHHGGRAYFYPAGSQTPARPATRAAAYGHWRNNSSTVYEFMTSARLSPRYTSDGYYATANVSGSHSQKLSSTQPSRLRPGCPRGRTRRAATRSSSPGPPLSHGESDEEVLEVNGRTYVLPSESRYRRSSTSMGMRPRLGADLPRCSSKHHFEDNDERDTDHYVHKQGGVTFDDRDATAYESSSRARETAATPRPSQTRRTSASIPTRPQTARPASSHGSKKTPSNTSAAAPASTPKVPKATEADAKKHHIPPGYSLKNWDPTESPILLLGSVFDANSLGKWIYDWTVFAQGPTHPISEIAGDMWLLLIQLAGKIRRAEDVLPEVRTEENQETIVEFLDSGERLMDKLRKLLKTCEEPMLKSAKKNALLGKNAGIEFVETLFGRDRVLDRTEKFMQGVRTFNLRFDANCDEIIKNPTM